MSEAKSHEEIKTMEGWEKAADQSKDPCQFSWDDYAKPGDLVDEAVYENFLNILPPRSMSGGYLQVGEPYSHRDNPRTGKYQATYMTFTWVREGIWRYCGNCFAGETNNVA